MTLQWRDVSKGPIREAELRNKAGVLILAFQYVGNLWLVRESDRDPWARCRPGGRIPDAVVKLLFREAA